MQKLTIDLNSEILEKNIKLNSPEFSKLLEKYVKNEIKIVNEMFNDLKSILLSTTN